MSLTPEQRSMRARLAAHAKWAKTSDRTAATEKARARAHILRWEREVDPNGELDPKTRAEMADSARRAYYARLTLKSSVARSQAKELIEEAEAAEAELAAQDGR